MNSTELDRLVASQVSPGRLAHCRSTARQAQSLLRRFCCDIPVEAGFVTGMWHDITREWSDNDLLAYSISHGIGMEEEEIACPMLLHGAVASRLLRQFVPDCDPTWELAVRWHTLGSDTMGRLGAALYIADYLEPLRSHLVREQRYAIVRLSSLEQMCSRIIEVHHGYLGRKGKVMARSTASLERFLEAGGRFTP